MDNKEPLPERKVIRLKDYDYSQNGAYFVTICTNNRAPYFGVLSSPSVGADLCVRPKAAYNIIEHWLLEIPKAFENTSIDIYTIMPDHIHLIIRIDRPLHAGGHAGPPLQRMMQWFKTMTTNEYTKGVKAGVLPPYDKKLWQRGFYDHVIRNEADYLECMEYIEQNPLKAHLLKQKDL